MGPGRGSGQGEVVGAAPSDTVVEAPGRSASWLWLLLAVVGAVLVGVLLANQGRDTQSENAVRTLPPTSAAPTTTAVGSTSAALDPVVVRAGRPLLDDQTGWELIARGPGLVARIEPALGRLTTTATPGLDDDIAAFVASAERVLVRPVSGGAGYLVPVGESALWLTELFTGSGPMLPGPDDDHVWLALERDGSAALVLTDLETGERGAAIPLREPLVSAVPDGAGNALFTSLTGVYAADLERTRPVRLGPGILLALGPKAALLSGCSTGGVCHLRLVDRATGTAKDLGERSAIETPLGVISPDARTAALFEFTGGGPRLLLIDLETGTRTRMPVRGRAVGVVGSLAWSPDSRYVFVVTDTKQIAVVDTDTTRVQALGVDLPPITQLAVVSSP